MTSRIHLTYSLSLSFSGLSVLSRSITVLALTTPSTDQSSMMSLSVMQKKTIHHVDGVRRVSATALSREAYF